MASRFSWLFVLACSSRVEHPLPRVAKPAPAKPRVVEPPVPKPKPPPPRQPPELDLADSGPVDWPTAWNVPSFTLLGRDVDRSVATVISANASTIGGFVRMDGSIEQAVLWQHGERVVLAVQYAEASEVHTLSADGRMYAIRWRQRLPALSSHGIVWNVDSRVPVLETDSRYQIELVSHDANAMVTVELARSYARVFDYSASEHTFHPRAVALRLDPLAVSYNARFLGAFDWETKKIVRYDTKTGQVTTIGSGTFGAMTRDANGFVLGDDDGKITVYRHGRPVTRLGLPGMRCRPFGISDDATRIVGHCVDGSSKHAFLWDRRHGMKKLADILAASKVDTEQRLVTYASGIDAKGTTIVGTVTDEDGELEAYVAIVPR